MEILKELGGALAVTAMCVTFLLCVTCGDAYAQAPPPPPPKPHWSDGYILLAQNNRPPEQELEADPYHSAVLVNEIDANVVIVPESNATSAGCDTTAAAVGVKAGGVSLSFPTYPCEIERTYLAIEHTLATDPNSGEQLHGFWTGKLPRFFLRTRLLSKGLFSAIFGLIGLG
ncbi:MAG: hypothetical protein V3S71_07475 [Acidobacteriota bacterium]